MKRILILRRFGSIGDMLMMTPSLRELGKTDRLDIAIPSEYHCVFFNLPYIFKILDVENLNFSLIKNGGKELKKDDIYDQIIDLTDFEFNYEQIFQPEIEKTKSEIFADSLNVKIQDQHPDIFLTNEEKIEVNTYFQNLKIDNKKTILFGIRSANPERDWSLENWKKLIEKFKKYDYNLIVVDKDILWDDGEIIFFNGKSVRELFALVSRSDYIICHDSGLLHIAGAFKKNSISIFGPTDPKVRCVYDNSHYVYNSLGIKPCWYNRKRNQNEYFDNISVEDVERKIMGVIKNEFRY